MKILKSGILIAFLIAFTGCSSDDDKSSQTLDTSQLIGQWNFKSIEPNDGEAPSDCELTSNLVFYNNGKTYTVLKADSTTDGCVNLIAGEHEYELVSKDKIHFKLIDGDVDDQFDATIISINATEMVLKDFVFPGTVITFKKAK